MHVKAWKWLGFGISKDFLKAGAPVNGPISEDDGINHHGFTPLHLAVMYKNTIAVEVLLRYGANVNLKDEDGTPLHAAFWMEAYVIARSDSRIYVNSCHYKPGEQRRQHWLVSLPHSLHR